MRDFVKMYEEVTRPQFIERLNSTPLAALSGASDFARQTARYQVAVELIGYVAEMREFDKDAGEDVIEEKLVRRIRSAYFSEARCERSSTSGLVNECASEVRQTLFGWYDASLEA